jgi:oligoendopeptidase F
LSFNHSSLPRDYPRRFLPEKVDLADTTQLKKFFSQLLQKPSGSKAELEKWLDDESEFLSAVSEEGFVRHIRMTCQTDDPIMEKSYLDFVERVEPELKKMAFELDKKYLGSKARKELSPERFSVLDRRKENNVSLFREANVVVEKIDATLGQKYQKTAGAMTVTYDGAERTLQQMGKYLEEPDRSVREKTWLLVEERRFRDREVLNKLYDDMLSLRARIAANAGFGNYRDYMFRKLARFDYTPDDCFRFHEAVEKHIVPIIRELDERRKEKLGVDPLRPWDMLVDPDGREALKPFKNSKELVEKSERAFNKLDPWFAKSFKRMAGLNLLDLDSRKGKAPGGYDYELPEIRLPFIFMNSVGRDTDMRTMHHESGHAFHTFASRDANYHFLYRGECMPAEFAEVASQGMEFLAGEHLEGTFYIHEDAVRSKKEHLEDETRLFPWVATIDAFQHWVYTHPGHTVKEREDFWVELVDRFGGGESWNGYEHFLRSRWQRQLHLYQFPFYYIEYGISLLGAMGVWYNYRKNAKAGVEAYKKALSLGGSRPLPELFKAAGVPFDFGPKTVEPYAKELRSILLA